MGWKQWTAIAVVIGGGILLQIPDHDDAMMEHDSMEGSAMQSEMAETEGPVRTVALEVTGMT